MQLYLKWDSNAEYPFDDMKHVMIINARIRTMSPANGIGNNNFCLFLFSFVCVYLFYLTV